MPRNKQEARFKAVVKSYMIDGYSYDGMCSFEDGVSYEVYLNSDKNQLRIVNDVVSSKIIVYKNGKFNNEYLNDVK